MKAYKDKKMAPVEFVKRVHSFVRDRRGVAALEFALIAPVMIALYMGSVEVTAGLDLNKNLGRATSMVADLINQQKTTISADDINKIMDIGTATLLPYTRDTPQITVTSITISAAKVATVAWSRRKVNLTYTTPYKAGDAVALNANLLVPSTSVIRVEMSVAYVPLMAFYMKNAVTTATGASEIGITMAKTAYGRVRQGTSLTCSGC